MLHLIAFSGIGDKTFACDYIVKPQDYSKLILRKKAITQGISSKTRELFTFHVIKSESKTFRNIRIEDPYFANAEVFTDFHNFSKAIIKEKNDMKLTDNKNYADNLLEEAL